MSYRGSFGELHPDAEELLQLLGDESETQKDERNDAAPMTIMFRVF